jgi:hypothetical protein
MDQARLGDAEPGRKGAIDAPDRPVGRRARRTWSERGRERAPDRPVAPGRVKPGSKWGRNPAAAARHAREPLYHLTREGQSKRNGAGGTSPGAGGAGDDGRSSDHATSQRRTGGRPVGGPDHGAIEQRILELAAGQHGLITRAQLLGAGLGPDAVKYRLRAKRLRAVQAGVYRVGPLVSRREREVAAALACGRARSSATGARRGSATW